MPSTSELTASTQADETTTARRPKRTKRATLVRKIHAVARDRQEAWHDGHPDLVDVLTSRLERLFEELRAHDARQRTKRAVLVRKIRIAARDRQNASPDRADVLAARLRRLVDELRRHDAQHDLGHPYRRAPGLMIGEHPRKARRLPAPWRTEA